MQCYCRRQEAYLRIGVIANQQAQQINDSTYQDNTRSNEWNAAPPLIQPSWNPSLRPWKKVVITDKQNSVSKQGAFLAIIYIHTQR